MTQGIWLFAGVYLYVNTPRAEMGTGSILESPIFHPPPCYHSGNDILYKNSCKVSLEKIHVYDKGGNIIPSQ